MQQNSSSGSDYALWVRERLRMVASQHSSLQILHEPPSLPSSHLSYILLLPASA